jgi:hypothetical protein
MLGLVAIVGVREVLAPAVPRHDARVHNAVQSVIQNALEVTEWGANAVLTSSYD